MFRGIFIDNFYFNYHIEANQVNFSPFSRFELAPSMYTTPYPPNVHLGTGFGSEALTTCFNDLGLLRPGIGPRSPACEVNAPPLSRRGCQDSKLKVFQVNGVKTQFRISV